MCVCVCNVSVCMLSGPTIWYWKTNCSTLPCQAISPTPTPIPQLRVVLDLNKDGSNGHSKVKEAHTDIISKTTEDSQGDSVAREGAQERAWPALVLKGLRRPDFGSDSVCVFSQRMKRKDLYSLFQ